MTRKFTLEQAQALLPEVERLMRSAVAARESYEAAEAEIQGVKRKAAVMGGVSMNPRRLRELNQSREAGAQTIRESIEGIHEMGVQVKDLNMGLADFPTLYRGAEVLLCWKLGETGISYWHGLEEGFGGRKRIDRDFLDHHEGGEEH